jgi:hypothetical protein
MAWTAVPPWYQKNTTGKTEVLFVTFLFGFTMALAVLTGAKACRQTYRGSARRRCWWNTYAVIVWVVWSCGLGIAVVYWIYIEGSIEPRFVVPQ